MRKNIKKVARLSLFSFSWSRLPEHSGQCKPSVLPARADFVSVGYSPLRQTYGCTTLKKYGNLQRIQEDLQLLKRVSREHWIYSCQQLRPAYGQTAGRDRSGQDLYGQNERQGYGQTGVSGLLAYFAGRRHAACPQHRPSYTQPAGSADHTGRYGKQECDC